MEKYIMSLKTGQSVEISQAVCEAIRERLKLLVPDPMLVMSSGSKIKAIVNIDEISSITELLHENNDFVFIDLIEELTSKLILVLKTRKSLFKPKNDMKLPPELEDIKVHNLIFKARRFVNDWKFRK